MLNRKVALLIIIFISLVVFTGSASADLAYMTVGDGDTTAQPGTPATYNWEQSPWLYFTSPSNILTYSISWWNAAGSPVITNTYEFTTGTSSIWHGFDEFADWAAIRKAGDWTVKADYSYYGGGPGTTGNINFRINAVPEPISSALFLLGGGAIAVLKLRKKKS
jgi:hypothetical protein